MTGDDTPTWGFPLVLRRPDANAPADAAVVLIRAGRCVGGGIAPLLDEAIAHNLHLVDLLRSAPTLLGPCGTKIPWSLSERYRHDVRRLKGSSAQLSALLALASRPSLELHVRPALITLGTVWATGVVTKDCGLDKVAEGDFPIKLEAFLRSQDVLFVVPSINQRILERRGHADLVRAAEWWTVGRLKSALLSPTGSGTELRKGHAKVCVRVEPDELPALLDALFSDYLTRFVLDSAKLAFLEATRKLQLAPDDPDQLANFISAAAARGDWKHAVGEMRRILRDADREQAPALAVTYARAVSSGWLRHYLSEPLWHEVLRFEPQHGEAQRVLLDHYREAARDDRLRDLLVARLRRDGLERDERVRILDELTELARRVGDETAAFDAQGQLLDVDPARGDVASVLASSLIARHGGTALCAMAARLANPAAQRTLLLAGVRDRTLKPAQRWEAVQALVEADSRCEGDDVGGEILRAALSAQTSPTALIKFAAERPRLRRGLLAHFCTLATERPTEVSPVNLLRRFAIVIGDLQVVEDALQVHQAHGLLARIMMGIGCDLSQPEPARRAALQRAQVAAGMASNSTALYQELAREVTEHPRASALLPFVLGCTRAFPDPALHRELLDAALVRETNPTAQVPLAIELGQLDELAGRRAEAFQRYYEAALRGLPPGDLSGRIDWTVEAAFEESPLREDRYAVVAYLLRWDPTLRSTRKLFEKLAEATNDWESLVKSKTYRLNQSAATDRVGLLWEIAQIQHERLHAQAAAAARCEEILRLDPHHAHASRLLSQLRSSPATSPAPRAPATPPRMPSATTAPRSALALGDHVPAPMAGFAPPRASGESSMGSAPGRPAQSADHPSVPPPTRDLTPPRAELASAAQGLGSNVPTMRPSPPTPLPSEVPAELAPEDILGATSWEVEVLEVMRSRGAGTDDALRAMVRRARGRNELGALTAAFRISCAPRDPILYKRFLAATATSPMDGGSQPRKVSRAEQEVGARSEGVPSSVRATNSAQRSEQGRPSAPPSTPTHIPTHPEPTLAQTISAKRWQKPVKALNAMPKPEAAKRIHSLVVTARARGAVEELGLAFRLWCSESSPELHREFLEISARLARGRTPPTLSRSPPDAGAASTGSPPKIETSRQRGVNPEIAGLVTQGNDPRTRDSHERFTRAADLALIELGEAYRAACLYAHARLARELPGGAPTYTDRSEYTARSTMTVAAVAVTLKRAVSEPRAAPDSLRCARLRAVARFLLEHAKDEVGSASVQFQLASGEDADDESLRDLADALRRPDARDAIRKQWRDHPSFRDVLRRVLGQFDLVRHRDRPQGPKSANVLEFAGSLFEMMDEPREALACYGWAMCADPSRAEVRALLRAVGKRSGLLPAVDEAYCGAVARHGADRAVTDLRLELAVVRLVLGQIGQARAAIASVTRSQEDDEQRRAIMGAVRSSSPPTGAVAWDLLP